ncbi:MAG: ribonuclease HII [Desulfobacteraceae bacterium]|nr:ribonuclease HII [Desulfobacteraceae bacterium]MCB9494671.1 ribonuclease HII [Desulfobacteraceae bacterium]
MHKLYFENKALEKGYNVIAGVDEAGRGPLAGPVVAAAVILPDNFECSDIDDSKKLSETKREKLAEIICQTCKVGVGISSPEIIDKVNIRNASLMAMVKAVYCLDIRPDCILVDGNARTDCGIYEETIVKGDSKSLSIGAASIIAKVFRDKIMEEYAKIYPHYFFENHKGYPTKKHKEAIALHGILPIHRKTFKLQ